MNNIESKTGASIEAIQAHYDLSNRFYQLWLDPNLVYSGALWQQGYNLEQAQINKLDYHISASRASHSKLVLDIGCGWGALLRRLIKKYGVEHAVGLTLSQAQYEWINNLSLPEVDVRLENWQDHQPKDKYNAIISIGAFEHFATLEMSEADKVNVYRHFFCKCQKILQSNGYLSLQTFAYGAARSRSEAKSKDSTQFLSQEIFRETDPPRLANIADAIEGYFEIVDFHNDRMGYAKTCKGWLDNLREQKKAAIALVGEEAYQRYQTYLSYSYIGFKTGNLDLYRITLKRLEQRKNIKNGLII